MSELDTFVLKFNQLWKCGHEAQLNVEAKNGKAWVNLRLCLDDEPGPLHDPFNVTKFKISPSRERRKIRRESARQENPRKESETIIVTEEATNDVTETEDKVDAVAVEAIKCIPEKANTTESVDEAPLETDSKVVAGANELLQNNNCDVATSLDDNSERKEKEEAEEKVVTVSDVGDMVTEPEQKPVRPSIEYVFATAVIEKSIASQVSEAEINALQTIIRSKEHLKRNIISVNLGSIQSYGPRDGKFEHLIQIVINVNTGALWEGSRSYIYHHLGRDVWTMGDGTQISLKRIHQKM